MIDFKKYDKENPHIWKEFVRIAKITQDKGFSRYSSKGIFELIRWHTSARGNDGFKLNNNYHADYGRKLMREVNGFEGWIKTRKLKAKRL